MQKYALVVLHLHFSVGSLCASDLPVSIQPIHTHSPPSPFRTDSFKMAEKDIANNETSEIDAIAVEINTPAPAAEEEVTVADNWTVPTDHFGKCLYSFESLPIKGRGLSTTTTVSFYNELVVFQEESKFLCYPKFYSQKIIPKYQFKDVQVSSKNPLFWVAVAFICVMIGSLMMTKDSMETGGIATMIVGVLLTLLPFINRCCGWNTYSVTFEVVTSKEKGFARLVQEYIDFWLNIIGYGAKPSSITINTFTKPDTAVLVDYVYGGLSSDMTDMHLMHHLITADLSHAVRPKVLGDLHKPDYIRKPLAVPDYSDEENGIKAEGEEEAEALVTSLTLISATKLGQILLKVASKVSASVYSERTIVTFFEQVVLFQEERQLLCFPMWFSQFVVPKYKFSSMTTEKTDPRMFLSVGALFFFGGCGFCASKMIPGGVVLILLSLPILVWPCFVSTYEIVFSIDNFKDSGLSKIIRSLFPMIFKQTAYTISIKTTDKPETDVMMEYVFGPLSEEISAVHSLNHLLHDDVTKILSPRSLSAFTEDHPDFVSDNGMS